MSRYRRFARRPAPCTEHRAQAAGGGSAANDARCTCGDCAELDLDHPGEGIQLAPPIHPVAHLARVRAEQEHA